MKSKDREQFTVRASMALATAMADKNYTDADIIVRALAKEHAVRWPAP